MADIRCTEMFIASSINDFHDERMEIGALVQQLNSRFVRQGEYLKLNMCEDMSDAIAADEKNRKQEEYNRAIRRSRLFILLADRNVGEYTVEELFVADAQHEETGDPYICIFIKKREGEELSDDMKRLQEFAVSKKYECEMFEDMDVVKRKIEEKMGELICREEA